MNVSEHFVATERFYSVAMEGVLQMLSTLLQNWPGSFILTDHPYFRKHCM